jgi:hypothetical protein
LDLPFQQLRFIIETGAQEPHGAWGGLRYWYDVKI